MDLLFPKDAWRCQQCQKLIHNVDGEGYPIKGAPIPRNFSITYFQLCNVCYTMLKTVYDSNYWKQHQADWETEQRNRKKKLGDGKDYFGENR